MKASQNIAQRSVTSVGWNVIASIVQVIVGFARSVLLARWISVEVFGVYRMANSVVALSAIAANFGIGGAFLHRAPETEDEEQAAAVHLTLKLMFVSVWTILLVTWICVCTSGQNRTALLVFTFTQGGIFLCQTPRMILVRRVAHRRLALLQLVNVLSSAVAALFLAWRGVGLGALLATDAVTLILTIFFLYVWRPVWRPRLAWSPPAMRYFLRFGSRNVTAIAFSRALDRVDDLWAGAYLGDTALGFYSRAYTFATYPRTILASSINKVAGGTYAELKKDRLRLSRAFFRTNAFLIRSGFLLAGLLALVAPEFIRLLIGAKWLPMLDAFRLMLVFTLFDPIKKTVSNLFVAVGKPDEVVRARAIQLAVMLAGLFLLGPPLGIAGVALAVDVMLVVGMAILLWQAQKYVDFSLRALLVVPGVGLVLSMLLARAATTLPGVSGSDWRTGFVKAVVFTLVYGTTLLILERRELFKMLSFLTRQVKTP